MMYNNNLTKITDRLNEQLEKLNLNFKRIVHSIHIFESNVSTELEVLKHNLSSLNSLDNYEENLYNIIDKFIEVEKFVNNVGDVLDDNVSHQPTAKAVGLRS